MAKEKYIVGLDIGTAYVRAVQAKILPGTEEFSIVGAAEIVSQGLRKGQVVDIEEAVSCISTVLEKVERMTGVGIAAANVSVGGSHISAGPSHGVIAVSRPDGEITEADIIRCIDASQAISIPTNREVLHVFPKTFTLDGQTGIRDPLGMSGIRLEVETIIVQAGGPFVRNLNKALLQAGLETDELVLAPLAASEAVLNKRQKDLGVCVLDLGAGTTGLAVYEEGDLMHTAVLPIGFQHITNDIAIGLRTSVETAEKVKINFGHADPKNAGKGETVDLSQLDQLETQSVDRQYVLEIIEARLEEIFSQVSGELKRIGRDGKLPSGVVLTGGGALMPGIADFAKKFLRLPAILGFPENIDTVIDRVKSPEFATVVGLAMWGDKFGHGGSAGGVFTHFNSLFSPKIFEKVKQWLKALIP